MLVVSRRVNESIIIDGIITVTVLRTSCGQVRLGISAPSNVTINRTEVEQRKNESEAKRNKNRQLEGDEEV